MLRYRLFSRFVPRVVANRPATILCTRPLSEDREIFEDIEYSYTNSLYFKNHEPENALPAYRVLDKRGDILNEKEDPDLDQETLLKIYHQMTILNVMDTVLYDVQRQGRISFYMTSTGEEAALFGSAAALVDEDIVYAQYREPGVLMWRGFTLDQFMNQCFANSEDEGKGRQMPVHYGSKAHNFHTISSPLATQIPQAVGSGYALKREAEMKGKPLDRCTIVYFGDGAASEGDFHAAMNFAVTLSSPVIFFCRNNKYAISTPAHEQYGGDAIGGRGVAYGMNTIRVDGNDVLAVYNATKEARARCVGECKPVLIEAMTYRIGHHSTSDDSSRYRQQSEIQNWRETNNPITRLGYYLQKRGWWSEDQEKELRASVRKQVLASLSTAEQKLRPPLADLFNDVYDELTPNLVEQKKELEQHLAKYPNEYPTSLHQ